MIDWQPYLESICQKYAQWGYSYTITDVVGKNRDRQITDEQPIKSLLFDLQAIAIQSESIQPDRELLPEARETRENLNVLEGLRKYARGRPGSGKSTALVQLLLEEAGKCGDVGNIVNVIGGNNTFGDISSNKGK
ncbi:hypothetical protein [Calothrix sp. UHCC 0171]|uniref:hypothetical protein n=1 Tax=Calothrix sp. UHCC 0171 TaxID=3110245 RepID=UPI002B2214FC|nr:hypothetical protein [Calothrix sp. UHCC 0171]MEA5574749.1 hypothetical protein [Calothrix sp. UHCC 0171]